MDGVRRLRDERGVEKVSFTTSWDHHVDFVDRDPAARVSWTGRRRSSPSERRANRH